MKLHVFEDGTNSFDKAKEFLESCSAAPMIYEDIDKIMMEEVEAFLAGDKSARETAEIIDNRVRIYLNE